MKQRWASVVLRLGVVAAALLLTAGCLPDDAPVVGERPVASSGEPAALPAEVAPAVQTAAPVPVDAQPVTQPDLLQAAGDGDGDSWHDTVGREYRLGLVNTPERNECFGAEATAERIRLVGNGFRATTYAGDRYERSVSVVTTADGVNVNLHLARHGFADDRYLEQFRHENPSLAAQLDAAFAAARAERAGLWGSCRGPSEVQGLVAPPAAAPPAAAPPAAGACHPDYATCIPVQGDGSGRGSANDLDCGQIDQRVQLRQVGVDPYRLDADHDGFGCD